MIPIVVATLWCFAPPPSTKVPPKQVRPPNIVFILADDLGAFDLGCDGRKDHRTPNIDRLATEGARFTCSYAGASICSPTRASLITGLSPARLHITTFLPGRADAPSQKMLQPKIASFLAKETPTLPALLKLAGYATGCFGKWHLGGKGHMPTDHGFDVYDPAKGNTTPSESEGGKGEFALTAAACAFAEKNQDRPFFVYLAHNAPHIPYTARADRIKMNAAAFDPTYAAVVESLDDSIGVLLKKLDSLGVAGNTIVVFTSDNGGLHVPELTLPRVTHNGKLRAGKGFLYEGGLRVPAIVRWPGKVNPGSTIDAPIITMDWLPTFLEMAGQKSPESLDGVSLVGLMQRSVKLADRPLFWHQPHYTNQGGLPGTAVREQNWKLIEWTEDGHVELFDPANDPGETINLAGKQPESVKAMRAKIAGWKKSVDAQEMTENPNFDVKLHNGIYFKPDPSKFAPLTASDADWAVIREWRTRTDAIVRKK